MEKDKEFAIGKYILGKYLLSKKLGEGSFGKIFKIEYDSQVYAAKIEKKRHSNSLLKFEASIMQELSGPGIPKIYSFIQCTEYNIMIMQLLGKSLEFLLQQNPNKKMSIKTVSMLGIQILTVLEYIHNKHYLHRDIKPDNFTMGINEEKKKLYIIDFGLAKRYIDERTLKHHPLIYRKKLIGTARFASVHALEGYEQSRRDDLESVGYIMLYLINGFLPWQGYLIKSKGDKYAKILERKKNISNRELTKNIPEQFTFFLTYVRTLEFEEDPDYEYLKNLLRNTIKEIGGINDNVYDWMNPIITSRCFTFLSKKDNLSTVNNITKTTNKAKISEPISQVPNSNKIIMNNYISNHSNTFIFNKREKNLSLKLNSQKDEGLAKHNTFENNFFKKNKNIGLILDKRIEKPIITEKDLEKPLEGEKKSKRKSKGCISQCCLLF